MKKANPHPMLPAASSLCTHTLQKNSALSPLSLPAQKECEFFWGLINQKMWSREKPGCWDYFLTKFCQQLVVHAPTLSTKFQPFLPLPSCKITIFHVLRALYVWERKCGPRESKEAAIPFSSIFASH